MRRRRRARVFGTLSCSSRHPFEIATGQSPFLGGRRSIPAPVGETPAGASKGRTMAKTYRIAVIPGDGIGKEVVDEGVRVLERAAKLHGFTLALDWFDFSSCDYYEKHGRMMPENW